MFQRVYYQGEDNYVYEHSFSDSSSWTSSGTRLPFKTAPDSYLDAIVYDVSPGKNDPQIRIYYISEALHLEEYCLNPAGTRGWFKGADFNDIAPNPLRETKVTALAWEGPEIRIYYQKTDLTLKEVVLTDGYGWVEGVGLK